MRAEYSLISDLSIQLLRSNGLTRRTVELGRSTSVEQNRLERHGGHLAVIILLKYSDFPL